MSSPQTRVPSAGDRGDFAQSLRKPAQPNGSRSPGLTQYERVVRVLVERGEACGHAVFYGQMMIPRFGSHLHRMKKRGFQLSRRPCDDFDHRHEGVAYIYRLEAVPNKLEGQPCDACGGILGHVSTCRGREAESGRLPGFGGA